MNGSKVIYSVYTMATLLIMWIALYAGNLVNLIPLEEDISFISIIFLLFCIPISHLPVPQDMIIYSIAHTMSCDILNRSHSIM